MAKQKQITVTQAAPAPIGAYSQGVIHDNLVFLSCQIPLDPATGALVDGPEAQIRQAFTNVEALCQSVGTGLDSIVKLTIYLSDLSHFSTVNEIMQEIFTSPYPARSAIGVAALPKGALIGVEAIVATS